MSDEGAAKPQVDIVYCPGCRWLLRAGWTAQELLSTFEAELGAVRLVPGSSGVFRVLLDGETLWDRKTQGGFPEMKDLKRLIRDRTQPGRDLGHLER